jgi:hypothetical protein
MPTGESGNGRGFDPEEAKARAVGALQLLESGRTNEWRGLLMDALEETARTHDTLTADDVWRVLGFGPPSERAGKHIGTALRLGVRLGIIAHTGMPAERSRRRGSHAKLVRRWISLRFEGRAPAAA